MDLNNATIEILDAADIQRRKLKGKTKTDSGERMFTLDAETLLLLIKQLNGQKEISLHGQSLVFRSDDGRVLGYNSLHKTWRRILKRAGLQSYRPHELRHSYITHLLDEHGQLFAANLSAGS